MKTVILGAGASGLGVAWGLAEKGEANILVLEKDAVVGGLSGSIKIGENTVDFGPHRFSPEYPELVQRAKDLLKEDWLEVSNEHAVVFRGRTYRYPPVILDFLNLPTIWLCVRVLASFGWFRATRLFRQSAEKETFENIIVNRFGRVLYEEVVKPMCWKVWGDPKDLDPGFARLRFSVPTVVSWYKKLVEKNSQFNDKVFFYPRFGFQQLWDEISRMLQGKGIQIVTNAVVTSIESKEGQISKVTYRQNGKEITVPVHNLVSTIPTQNFVRLLSPAPIPPAELLSAQFRNKGMLLVYFMIRKETVLPARVVIFPEEKYVFNRLSEQNQFSRWTVKAGHSVVLADVLAEVGTDTWNCDDVVLAQRCKDTLIRLGYIFDEDVVESKVLRVPLAYPLPTSEREKEQTKFNQILSQYKNLICTGRFASSDYNNSHSALKKGFMASEAIASKTSPTVWYQSAEMIRKTAIRD